MTEEKGLLSAAWQRVRENWRYIFWFWLLNVTLAEFGTAAYRGQLRSVLDKSLYSNQLVDGFNFTTYFELTINPQLGSIMGARLSAFYFAFLFALASLVLMPGVFRQYTSEYRVSKEEFFRTCGRNLWRYVRLTLVYALIMLPLSGILFGIHYGLGKAAEKSLNEMAPFWMSLVTLLIIFLVLTMVRIFFDIAEVDLVVRDQPSAWRAIGNGFRYGRRFLGRLLGSYCVIALFAFAIAVVGVWLWKTIVPANRWFGGFVIAQVMLFLLLAMRFWQRSVAAQFFMREMLVVSAPAPFRAAPAEPIVGGGVVGNPAPAGGSN
jgi:hypothetical protein